MVEPRLKPGQIEVGAPVDTVTATPQSVPDDTIQLSAGNVLMQDMKTLKPFAAASSGAFGALTSPDVSRWDLLSLDVSGPNPVLSIDVGTPDTAPQNFEDSIPSVPITKIAMFAIHITEVSPSPVIVNVSDIEDVREFFHRLNLLSDVAPLTLAAAAAAGSGVSVAREDHQHGHGNLSLLPAGSQHDSQQIPHSQQTPADWNTASGASSKNHLDELGGRLNTPTIPSDGGVSAGLGSSLDAPHADHVHAHGDLRAAGGIQHDTLQSEHTQAVPANWSVADPATAKASLDELAARLISVEGGALITVDPIQSRRISIVASLVTVRQGTRALMYDTDVLNGATPTLSKQAVLTGDLTHGIGTNGWNYIYLIGDTSGSNATEVEVSTDYSDTFAAIIPAGFDVFRLIGSIFQSVGSFLPSDAHGDWHWYHNEIAFMSVFQPLAGNFASTELQSETAVAGRILARGNDNSGTAAGDVFLGSELATVGRRATSTQNGNSLDNNEVTIPLVGTNGNVQLMANLTSGASLIMSALGYQERL